MATGPKILAFAGSLRKDSFNKKLVKIAVKGAQEAGGDVTYIDLNDFSLPLLNEDIEAIEGLPENAIKLKDLLNQSQGFLISTPEYNSCVSGVLKNMIDWASRQAKPEEPNLFSFTNKVAVVMSASQGGFGALTALNTLKLILQDINTLVLTHSLSISKANTAFDASDKLVNAKHQESALNLGKTLVEYLNNKK